MDDTVVAEKLKELTNAVALALRIIKTIHFKSPNLDVLIEDVRGAFREASRLIQELHEARPALSASARQILDNQKNERDKASRLFSLAETKIAKRRRSQKRPYRQARTKRQ